MVFSRYAFVRSRPGLNSFSYASESALIAERDKCAHARKIYVFVAALVLAIFSYLSAGTATAEVPDYWAQHNKDGNWRNSSNKSLNGTPRIRWSVALRGFFPNQAFPTWGNRSNDLSVRNGQVLVIVPPPSPHSPPTEGFANYGIFSLADGRSLNIAASPHVAGGAVLTHPPPGIGVMDSDTTYGLINQYWKADGTVHTAHGSDQGWSAEFDAFTGENPFGMPRVYLNGGINGSGYFAMSDSNPLIYAMGGGGGHGSFLNGIGGVIGIGTFGLPSMKMYGSFVVEGNWIYPLSVTNIAVDNTWTSKAYGIQIKGMEIQASPWAVNSRWTFTDPNKMFLGFGLHHGRGAPRAYCLGDDDRLYAWAFKTLGSGVSQAPNFSAGMSLLGVQAATGANDISIDVPYNPASENSLNPATLAQALQPQIAARGNKVIVFQPQQSPTNGHLFCFDTTTRTLAWRKDFPSNYFQTNTLSRGGENSESYFDGNTGEAVQATIAGDSAYIVEPFVSSGVLRVRVERFALADGSQTTTIITPQSGGNDITVSNAATVAMREVAAVDGTLTGLIDFDQMNQAVVVIDGSSNTPIDYAPSAIISAPIIGKSDVYPIISDWPTTPTNQFDSGASISFSSQGSSDPDGGNLTYAWDFGDGTTSALANPNHTYAASGTMLSVMNRTVTLIVRDNEGNFSPPVTRVVAIRNVGALQHTVLTAVADAYVDPANAGSNYGTSSAMSADYYGKRAFVRFSLSSVNTANVVSAVLRVWAPDRSIDSPFRVFDSSPSWEETTITHSNAPSVGPLVNVMVVDKYMNPLSGGYLDFNVTEDVRNKSGGAVSFMLDSVKNPGRLNMSARESVYAPQLMLLTGSTDYMAPVFTEQPADRVVEETFSAAFAARAHSSSPLGDNELSYHWQIVSAPTGGSLDFQPNHSNAAKDTTITAISGIVGTYTLRCIVSDTLGQTVASRTASISFSEFSNPLVKINFQPAGASPTGYLPDTGAVFGNRGNGWSYGWSSDHSSMSRFRNTGLPLEVDTLISFQAGASWEIAIPNGTYKVAMSIGDSCGESTNTLNAETVNFWTSQYLASNQFRSMMQVVTVSDGRLTLNVGSAPTWATRINYIKIAPAAGGNHPPVITSSAVVSPNPLMVAQSGTFSVAASDADGDPLNYVWAFGDGISATGSNTSHVYSSAGSFTATVTVSDGHGGTAASSVNVTVNAVANTPPVVIGQNIGTNEDTPKAITLSATDSNGDPLTYTIVGMPAHGSVTGSPPNVTYVPTANYNGPDAFTFKANDGLIDSNVATVSIVVAAINDNPTITTGPLAAPNPSSVGQNVTFSVTAIDVDGDNLTYSWNFGDGAVSTGAAPGHSYNVAGAYTTNVTVTDGHGGSATGSVTVVVNSNAAPPTAPTGLAATTASSSQINLAWTDTANNESGFKIERSNGSGSGFALKLDLNNGASPTEAGYTGFPLQTYNTAVGYGWQNTSGMDTRDRGSGSNLQRDFHFSHGDHDFLVDVPNGDYTINITFGDAAMGHDLEDVYAEGALKLNNITTTGSQFRTETFVVTVNDGQLNLGFHDDGGSDSNWCINAIEVIGGNASTWSEIASVGANVTTYSNTGLTANTTYNYRVRSYNSSGNSAYSNTATAQTVPASNNNPPIITAGPSVVPDPATVGQNVAFSVTAVDSDGDALSYNWSFGDGTSGTGATPSHTYGSAGTFMASVSVNDGRGGSTSGIVSLTVNSGGALPAAPTNLAASSLSSSQINVMWTDNSSNEGGFKIERSTTFSRKLDFNNGNSPTAAGFTGFPLQTYSAAVGYGWQSIVGMESRDRITGNNLQRDFHFGAADSTFVMDVPNGDYTVTVHLGDAAASHDLEDVYAEGALKVDNVTTNSGEIVARTFTTTVSDGQLTLRFHDDGGNNPHWCVVGVEVSANTSSAWTETATVGANVATFANTGLSPLTTYNYRVRAYNSVGNSAYSNVVTVTTGGN